MREGLPQQGIIGNMNLKINGCTDPLRCKKCLDICPAKVIILKPVNSKGSYSDLKTWRLSMIFKTFCNGCLKCVEVCEKKYILVDTTEHGHS